ncbi:XdhC family protein [Pseudomonas chlororaphis]|uniref:Xanthine dehydrogenase accessory factor n=1 Tax=Pseudomonas chlororaphis TaxID=587753 RepID=A0AAQ2YFF6_9PSED|nr:XdhC family protein [Pseudomonas chlororaphis]AZC29794.1 Xanthine/CO dehydrogenase maturation factor, XdhC/CoxF family [Pseudomonas chlororaphis subsp. piscium]AZC36278.1 Xanthine/CO dehydrogenase maturation factor, XdhC/CoxF family [Pseudomonas chlororaphis subsp. piscium]AZC42824.1 Xanthine/CO dehydrogenase maturation factor, XdhC/CoxF family [Pseudomonas chlororaphis subsp. piscium]WDG74730.1 XdhC family protein [Pseudomonas chlororaphis]WDG79467.1 XdhC family protein [Pseudomonas chloro
MDSVDLNVLRSVLEWRRAGQGVTLYSVVQTWGSAPRPPGAMLALREDGMVIGSVSGGCIEDDLIARLHDGRLPQDGPPVQWVTYGVTREEAARFGLPCGGTLRLTEERVGDPAWVAELLARCEAHEIVARELNLGSGEVLLKPASKTDVLSFDETTLRAIYGPRWRLLLIGAGQLSRYVAEMARLLDFEVLICDPRKEFVYGWEEQHGRFVPGMPDDAVLSIETDERTAIVALTHDPRLDDMALLTALNSRAFYVGALGSRVNSQKRRENLAQLGLEPQAIERLHGPIGLHIGSHTPAEIALSVMSEIVAIKNGIDLLQKKPSQVTAQVSA